ELGAERVRLDAERPRERRPHVAHLRRVLEPRLQVAGARAVADRPQELAAEVRLRVARDGDVVEVARLEAGVGETPRSRELREAGAVLDAVEALLLGRRDKLAVDDERRRRVAVERVQTQDGSHDDNVTARRIGWMNEATASAVASARDLPFEGRPPIIVGGLPRNGTTLVGRLLGSHSEIALPPAELG